MGKADPVYLSRIELANFRSLGKAKLAFHPGPGVVLLEGPNGLGKTSLLEAIELALTQTVHRWARLDEEHGAKTRTQARRAGTPAGATARIAVGFSGLGGREAIWSEQGSGHESATWLCEQPDTWSLTSKNLNEFLRGTHFLPQAPHLRLLHLADGDRWDKVLRNVSGYSEMDDLSDALQKCKGPATEAVKQRSQRVEELGQKVDSWHQRVLAHQGRRAAAETAGDAVPPSVAVGELAIVDRPSAAVLDSEDGARRALEALAATTRALRQSRASIEERRAHLAEAVGVPARWDAGQLRLERAQALVTTRTSAAEDSAASLVAARNQEAAARRQLADTQTVLRAAEDNVETALRLVAAVESLPALRSKMQERQVAVAAAAVQLGSVRTAHDEAAVRSKARRLWEDEHARLSQRLGTHQRAIDAWGRVKELLIERERAAEKLRELATALDAAGRSIKEAETTKEALDVAVRFARSQAVAVRDAAGQVRSLVAALMEHIHAQTEDCPLCLAKYASDGTLLRRVLDAQKHANAPLAQAEERLRAANEALAVSTAELAARRDALAVLKTAFDAQDAIIAGVAASEREERLLLVGIPAGEEGATLESLMAGARAELAASAGRAEARFEALALLEARRSELAAAVVAADNALREARSGVGAVASQLVEADGTIAQSRSLLALEPEAPLDGLVQSMEARRAAAAQQLGLATVAATNARVARETVEVHLQQAVAERTTATSEFDAATAELATLGRHWTGLGGELPPTLQRHEDWMVSFEGEVAEMERRIHVIVAASERVGRWMALASTHREAQLLDAEAGGAGQVGWTAHEHTLHAAFANAERARDRAQVAREEIERLADAAAAKRESMRTDLADRLDPILKPLLRSLVVDQEIASAVVRFYEARKKTRMDASIGNGSVPLVVRASEGQLSGVNMAVQLAMALAFRWSRWPALLLDDPAQYSDVVHSTNLVETLRTFSRVHGFQVFLATHERDFARYVEQKFKNDGLAAARVIFREPADRSAGVEPYVSVRDDSGR